MSVDSNLKNFIQTSIAKHMIELNDFKEITDKLLDKFQAKLNALYACENFRNTRSENALILEDAKKSMRVNFECKKLQYVKISDNIYKYHMLFTMSPENSVTLTVISSEQIKKIRSTVEHFNLGVVDETSPTVCVWKWGCGEMMSVEIIACESTRSLHDDDITPDVDKLIIIAQIGHENDNTFGNAKFRYENNHKFNSVFEHVLKSIGRRFESNPTRDCDIIYLIIGEMVNLHGKLFEINERVDNLIKDMD